MGDEWPYGPPERQTFEQLRAAAHTAGFPGTTDKVMAAIATAESDRDLHVVNNTPATGDLSVGAWQVNYYGPLYAGRAAAFGTPRQLAHAGAAGQARAAYAIWRGQGFAAWSTFTSGAYLQFLPGGVTPPGGGAVGGSAGPVLTAINPPTGDYSGWLLHTAVRVRNTGNSLVAASKVLHSIKDTNPHG